MRAFTEQLFDSLYSTMLSDEDVELEKCHVSLCTVALNAREHEVRYMMIAATTGRREVIERAFGA